MINFVEKVSVSRLINRIVKLLQYYIMYRFPHTSHNGQMPEILNFNAFNDVILENVAEVLYPEIPEFYLF